MSCGNCLASATTNIQAEPCSRKHSASHLLLFPRVSNTVCSWRLMINFLSSLLLCLNTQAKFKDYIAYLVLRVLLKISNLWPILSFFRKANWHSELTYLPGNCMKEQSPSSSIYTQAHITQLKSYVCFYMKWLRVLRFLQEHKSRIVI